MYQDGKMVFVFTNSGGEHRKQKENVLGVHKCSLCTYTANLPSPIRTKPQRHSASVSEVGKKRNPRTKATLPSKQFYFYYWENVGERRTSKMASLDKATT